MSNILFLFDNIFDLATLTESSQDEDFPAENLQSPFRTKIWKTAGATPGTANLIINHGDLYGELVTNGGFGSDTAGWNAGNSATLASVAGGKSGNCLRITCNGEDNPYAYQDINITPGNCYKFCGYVKAGDEATYLVIIRDRINDVIIYSTGYQETAGDWSTIIEKEFVAPAGCTLIRIYLYQITSAGAGTTLFYDSVSLKQSNWLTAIALVNYNWESAPSTLDLEFSSDNEWGTPDGGTESLTWLANPDTYGNPNIIIKTFASKNYQYNRLNVVNAGGDWELGRIFLGNYFEPTRSYAHDRTERIIDPSFVDMTVDGQEHVDELTKYREREIIFKFSNHNQYQNFQKIINNVGIGKNIVVAFDYDSYPGDQTMYGKIKKCDSRMSYNLYEIAMLFRESR